MSKQDIEKRLGFAAQGVKAEFGSNDPYMQERTVKTRKGKTTDLVAEIGQNGGGGDYIATLMLVHSNGEPQVLQSKYGYKTPESATRAAIRLFDAHVSRGGYARSGAKAKMAAGQVARFRIGKNTNEGYSVIPLNAEGSVVTAVYKEIGFRHSFPTVNAAMTKAKQMQAKYGGTISIEDKQVASRPGVKAKMSATFIVAEAIFNAENAVRRGDNENARRWIKAAQDAMDETVVSTGMRSKLEQLVKRYKMSRPGMKAKMGSSQVNDSATTADLIREAQRLRDVIKTSNREFDKTHLRQIKQELDRRGVLMPYGASEVLASRSGMKAKA